MPLEPPYDELKRALIESDPDTAYTNAVISAAQSERIGDRAGAEGFAAIARELMAEGYHKRRSPRPTRADA